MTPKERAFRIMHKSSLAAAEKEIEEDVREAQAAAIEQAANVNQRVASCWRYCDGSYHVVGHRLAECAKTILALSPINPELLRLKERREEAQWWKRKIEDLHLRPRHEPMSVELVDCYKRLADLDARIKVLEEE